MKKIFILLSSILLISVACNKEEFKTKNSDQIQMQEVNFTTLNDQLSTIWHYAWNNYSMEVVCGCDCESYDAVKNTLNSNLHILDYYTTLSDTESDEVSYNCNQFLNGIKFECNYTDLNDQLVYIESKIDSMSFPPLEKELVKEVMNRTKSLGYFDVSYFRFKWYYLRNEEGYNANYDYFFSAFIIELSASIQNFIYENIEPAEGSGFIGDGPHPAILPHIGGAIAGGLTAVVYEGFYSVFFEDPPSVTKEELKKSVIKGAVGGAISAI